MRSTLDIPPKWGDMQKLYIPSHWDDMRSIVNIVELYSLNFVEG